MNRGELREELYALGHRYLDQEPGRADRFVNQAGRDVILDEAWPQRVAEDVLLANQVLTSLGLVLQVWDTLTGSTVKPADRQELRDRYGVAAMAETGRPLSYWLQRNSVVGTWPVLPATQTITVEHYSKGVWDTGVTRILDATDDAHVLIGDGIFDEAVLLGSRLRALEDTDETGLREDIEIRLERELAGLRDRELNAIADEAPEIKQTREYC